MAVLRAKKRNALAKTQFALPGQRKYPINDAAHAKDALSRAKAQENKGAISPSTYAKIAAAAHRKLGSQRNAVHKAGNK